MSKKHDGAKEEHEKHEHSTVTITLDGNEVSIPKGEYLVSDLKARLGVPADYEFDLVDDGEFRPLSDNTTLKIKEPAIFVSHVRCGASS